MRTHYTSSFDCLRLGATKGTIMLVVLVFLAATALLGVSSLRSSLLLQKAGYSSRINSSTYQGAESALLLIQNYFKRVLESNVSGANDIVVSSLLAGRALEQCISMQGIGSSLCPASGVGATGSVTSSSAVTRLASRHALANSSAVLFEVSDFETEVTATFSQTNSSNSSSQHALKWIWISEPAAFSF